MVITKYGTPVAMLVPAESASSASAFGFLRGTVIEHEDIVAPDFEAWGND